MPGTKIPPKPGDLRGKAPHQPVHAGPTKGPESTAGFADLTVDLLQLIHGKLESPADRLQFADLSKATRAATQSESFRPFFRNLSLHPAEAGQLPATAAAFVAAYAASPQKVRHILSGLKRVSERVQTGRQPQVRAVQLPEGSIIQPSRLQWSRCGSFLSIGDAQQLHIFHLDSKKILSTQLPSSNSPGVGWSEAPIRLIVAHQGPPGGASAVDPQTGKRAALPLPEGICISNVRCAPRGGLVALQSTTAAPGGQIYIVDVQHNRLVEKIADTANLLAFEWSTNGKHLALQWERGATTLHAFTADGDRKGQQPSFPTSPTQPLLAWSEDTKLAVAAPAGQLQVYSAKGNLLHDRGPSQTVHQATWAASGDAIAEATPEGEVRIHQHLQPLAAPEDASPSGPNLFAESIALKEQGSAVDQMRLAPDAQTLALAYANSTRGKDGIDVSSKKFVKQSADLSIVRELSPDGSTWATLDDHKTLRFRRAGASPEGRLDIALGQLAPQPRPSTALWSPDATRFLLIYGKRILVVDLTQNARPSELAARQFALPPYR
jgi:hypothetical protein